MQLSEIIEKSHVPFTQFFPAGMLRKTMARYHRQETNVITVKILNQKGLSYCPFIVMPAPHYPYPSLTPASANLFPLSVALPFQECPISGIALRVTFRDPFFFTPHDYLEIHPGCGMN